MTIATTRPFDREIHYVPRRSDFCYDVFVHGDWVASARYAGAGDFVADEVGYAQVLAQPSTDTLVIRGNAPAQLAACVAAHPVCVTCGGEGDCPDCATPTGVCYVCGEPAWQTDTTDALLAEADAALPAHPGPRCDCPACQRATDRLVATTTMYRLICEAHAICQYCGAAHTDAACPQRQSVLPPTVCGNCGGTHSIQVCPELRAALFAA